MKKILILIISFALIATGHLAIAKSAQVLAMHDGMATFEHCGDSSKKINMGCCEKNCRCSNFSCGHSMAAIFDSKSRAINLEDREIFITNPSYMQSVAYTPLLRPPKA